MIRARAAAAGLLVLGVLVALGGPAAGAGSPKHPDARDTKGPLDLASASLRQDGTQLVLSLRTYGDWTPFQLDAARRRFLCALIYRSGRPRSALCASHDRAGHNALLAVKLGARARPVSSRVLPIAVHRDDRRSFEVRFEPADIGLPLGRFRWSVISAWTGPPCPRTAPSGICHDLLPDHGTLAGLVRRPRLAGCRPKAPFFSRSGPSARRLVALTFDDGPGPQTPQILRILERERVHATFFQIGRRIGGHGDLLRRMLDDGDVIGNHSYTHPVLSGGGAFALGQLRSTSAAIRRASAFTPCLFRPPYGAVSDALVADARSLGMNTINWDVDPLDWKTPGADAIYNRVVDGAHPGSIILMHDGPAHRGQTVAALPRIIATLAARGYGFVTVDELLGLERVYG